MPSSFSLPAPAAPETVPAPSLTRDGGNWYPEPEWENYPADTKSFSLAVEYPEAPEGGLLD